MLGDAEKTAAAVALTDGLATGGSPPSPDVSWLRSFEAQSGRRLRVLLIGNIAGNAYLISKKLREAGIESDVLCCDYYHMMACPEWEELEILHDWQDDSWPRFHRDDLRGYTRPQWFIQGPLEVCALYMQSRVMGRPWTTGLLRRLLPLACRPGQTAIIAGALARWVSHAGQTDTVLAGGKVRARPIGLALALLELLAGIAAAAVFLVVRQIWRTALALAALTVGAARVRTWRDRVRTILVGWEKGRRSARMGAAPPISFAVEAFARAFPNRPDRLTQAEIDDYRLPVALLEPVLKQYDIVQAFGVDPILPLLCRAHPYVAFEHGTLRDFTRGDNPVHRLNALAYRLADDVFVTNGDCLEHAQWLGIDKMSPMIHPVDVAQHERRDEAAIAASGKIMPPMSCCCARSGTDWGIKGTDTHLRALPAIVKRLAGKRVVLLLSPGRRYREEPPTDR